MSETDRNWRIVRGPLDLLILSIFAAHAVRPASADTGDPADTSSSSDTGTVWEEEGAPCPGLSGLDTVGTVWEYELNTLILTGWERVELTEKDEITGAVVLTTTGGRATDGYVYTFTRHDNFRCDADGLWLLGWDSTFSLTNSFAEFSVSSVRSAVGSYGLLLLPAVPLDGDWWRTTDTLTLYADDLEAPLEGEWSYHYEIGEPESYRLFDLDIEAIPVTANYSRSTTAYYPDEGLLTTWYAEGYGPIERDGYSLVSWTPGADTP